MIFATENAIQDIIAGRKLRTRRKSPRYQVGKKYAIQPGRTKPAIKEGRIRILKIRGETKNGYGYPISKKEAKLEGNYTPEEFEELYENMHKNWEWRYAYDIRFVKTKSYKSKKLDEF